MIWLFWGTTLEQETNPETDPVTIGQKGMREEGLSSY